MENQLRYKRWIKKIGDFFDGFIGGQFFMLLGFFFIEWIWISIDDFKSTIPPMLICTILFKGFYYVLYSLEKVTESYVKEKSFNWFLMQMTLVMGFVVLSFALDYSILYQNDNTSFKLLETSMLASVLEFFWYSFFVFTTLGFGEIVPQSSMAKLITSIEVVISFITIIYIVSNFQNIQKSLVKDQSFNRDYKPEKEKGHH